MVTVKIPIVRRPDFSRGGNNIQGWEKGFTLKPLKKLYVSGSHLLHFKILIKSLVHY